MSGVTLRDYQVAAVTGVRAAMREQQAVLLVAPTGAGKTVVFSHISESAYQRGKRVLILAHLDTLIKQASRKLRDNGVAHGIIMAGITPDRRAPVQVASVQTLARRLGKLGGWEPDLIIIDECDLSNAASYQKIVQAFPNARILGVTATPIRLDGKGLGRAWGGMFDAMVQAPNMRWMIDRGYLVQPEIFGSAQELDLSGVRKKGNDYDAEALASVVDKPKLIGDAVDHYARICNGVPALCWCVNIKHAQHVADQFNASGIPALVLSGDSSSDEREKALAALASGALRVITFAMLLVAGVDEPAIGALIILRPTLSLRAYLQAVGRTTRLHDGKKFSYILDHAGLWKKHGLPDEEREWSLEGRKKKPKGAKAIAETVDLVQCPKCFKVHAPSPECPKCGHVYEVKARAIEQEDGELVRITREMAAALKQQQKIEVARAKTLPELRLIAAQRGYKESWADQIFRARKGRRLPGALL